MPNALSTSPDSIFSSARASRQAYNDAVTTDGVSARAWWRIAGDLHASADAMTGVGTVDQVRELRGHAEEAEYNARRVERLVESARVGRSIDMSTLQWIPCVGAEAV